MVKDFHAVAVCLKAKLHRRCGLLARERLAVWGLGQASRRSRCLKTFLVKANPTGKQYYNKKGRPRGLHEGSEVSVMIKLQFNREQG